MEIVSGKYVQNLLGVAHDKAYKMIKQARTALKKEKHHVLTTQEFLTYYDIKQ